MGHLDKLKISKRVIAAAAPRRRIETVDYRRQKLIANIEEQIELVNLEISGKPLKLDRKRGHQVISVRPRIWWTTDAEGVVYTQIRYNKTPIDLVGKGTSVFAGTLKKLPAVYRTVIRATKAGELDQSIEAAAAKKK